MNLNILGMTQLRIKYNLLASQANTLNSNQLVDYYHLLSLCFCHYLAKQ